MPPIIERLDGKCRAQVLAVADTVLLKAFWPATQHDRQRGFQISGGLAFNTVNVSKAYFECRYGKVL
jgi:hypothetical protein